MSTLLNNLNINEFFRWWVQELGSMLPSKKFTAKNHMTGGVTVELDNKECFLNWENEAKKILCGKKFSLDDVTKNYRSSVFEDKKLAVDVCNIRLSNKYILRKTITLPLATEENLNNVVSYEMDRYTPFKKEDVYFDIKIKSRDKANNKLTIVLSVVKRRILDNVLEFASNLDLSIGSVYSESTLEGQSIEKYSFTEGLVDANSQNNKNTITKYLSIFLVILSLSALIIPIAKNYWSARLYQAELQNVQEEVNQAKKIVSEYKAVKKNVDYLKDLESGKIKAISLLNEITRIIPDDTFLNRFSLEERVIRMHGLSASASKLISILDASEEFSEVRFVAPVTQNSKTGKENFAIEIKFLDGGQSNADVQ